MESFNWEGFGSAKDLYLWFLLRFCSPLKCAEHCSVTTFRRESNKHRLKRERCDKAGLGTSYNVSLQNLVAVVLCWRTGQYQPRYQVIYPGLKEHDVFAIDVKKNIKKGCDINCRKCKKQPHKREMGRGWGHVIPVFNLTESETTAMCRLISRMFMYAAFMTFSSKMRWSISWLARYKTWEGG